MMRTPIYLRGERAASMHLVKVCGARDSPNGRTVYCEDFCAAVKHSAKLSTAGPKRPVVETGESRKAALSLF